MLLAALGLWALISGAYAGILNLTQMMVCYGVVSAVIELVFLWRRSRKRTFFQMCACTLVADLLLTAIFTAMLPTYSYRAACQALSARQDVAAHEPQGSKIAVSWRARPMTKGGYVILMEENGRRVRALFDPYTVDCLTAQKDE